MYRVRVRMTTHCLPLSSLAMGCVLSACFFAPCTQTTAKAYLLSSSTSNTLMTAISSLLLSNTHSLLDFKQYSSNFQPVNRIDVGNPFLFDAPLFLYMFFFLLWQCCGCDLVRFRHSDIIQFGLKYLLRVGVRANTAGNCPEVTLKISSDVTVTSKCFCPT